VSRPRTAKATLFGSPKATAPANTIVWLGDSFTGNGGGVGTPNPTLNYSRGFQHWGLNLLGQRLRTLTNAGVGGQTTVQVAARVASDVIALRPGWCHVLVGCNDITQSVPLATTQANLSAIWDALDRAGIRCVQGTIGPRGSWTGTQRAQFEALNAWIRDQSRRRNLVLVDYHAVLTQPSGGGAGAYGTGLNYDVTHPNTLGCYFMGLALANALSPLISGAPCPLLLSGEGDATNLLTQGRFGTGGSGSALSGAWGMALAGSPTLTYAKVARTDIPGSWQSILMAVGASVAFTASSNANVGASLAIGESVVGVVEYQLSALDTAGTAGNHLFHMQVQTYNGSSFTTTAADLSPLDSTGFPTASRNGVLLTPPLVVPAATTLVQMQIKASAGGTYLFDRAGIFNVSRLGIAA
jgi:lysophospholipase L1-like esterase